MDGVQGKQQRESKELGRENRRRMARVCTTRKVIFSRFDGSGPIREGVTVDIGAGGMQIRSPFSEAPGSDLTIELRPKNTEGDVAILRGVVTFVTEADDNEFAMGVRLNMKIGVGSWAPLGQQDFRRHFHRPIRVAASSRKWMTIDTRDTAHFVAPKKLVNTSPHRVWRKGWAWAGPALVFLLLLVFIPSAATYLSGAHRDGSIRTFTLTRNGVDTIPADPRRGRGRRSSSSGNAGGLYASVAGPSYEFLPEGEKTLFGTISDGLSKIEPTRVERFMVPLERALEAKERGDGDSTRQNVLDALALERVPEVWRDIARDLLTLDDGADAGSIDDFAMGDTFDIEPGSTAAAEVADFHLEVDLSEYVLTVVRDGAILREFPVGLGYDGATPLGEFQIANKLTNPAWYNRGDVVPAGDPANPLGRRWMGLGSGGVATSYGIHPTTAVDSIGQSASLGCIRMFPQDAETLFRLCPLGTRVVIHE